MAYLIKKPEILGSGGMSGDPFDSDTLALMGHAFDAAYTELCADSSNPSLARDLMALTILSAPTNGERDLERLKLIALTRSNSLEEAQMVAEVSARVNIATIFARSSLPLMRGSVSPAHPWDRVHELAVRRG